MGGEYALRDDYILPGGGKNATLFGAANIFPGRIIVVPGLTQYTVFNPTTELGLNSLVGISMAAWMGKNNYTVKKADEWIEVSPHHAQYYQLVMKQRDELEAKVREGLIRISQSLTDIELLEHDIRKYERYREIVDEASEDLSKLEKEAKKNKALAKKLKEEKKRKKTAEMALKSIFVDQVDYNAGRTGQGPGRMSMSFMRNSNIFPTIVDDFMEMSSLEDLESGNLSSLPVVEKNFLRVKFKYYQQWKEMFGKQVKIRLERLKQMHRSRMKSLDEFKKWATPYILRMRSIKPGFEDFGKFASEQMNSAVWEPGEAIGISHITWWGWRALTPDETFRETGELEQMAKLNEEYPGQTTGPYDDFTRDVLIFGEKYGLINDFPWLTKEWVEEKAKDITDSEGLEKSKYWTFMILRLTKYVFKNPKAGEFEDSAWGVYGITMSSNALLVKLMEHEAKIQDAKFYLDELLGREIELKKLDKFVGYVEEAGKYRAVIDGDYLKSKSGKPLQFSSLFDLFNGLKDSVGKDFRPIPAKIIYYKKQKGKFVIGGKEYDKLEDYVSEVKDKARKVSDQFESAKLRAYLLKPEASKWFEEFMEDWLGIKLNGWKYRKSSGLKYERDFYDRITQYYLVPTGVRWGTILGVLKSKFGI